eukprot:1181318-Prorocentrum_minimum.AAC.1
MERAPHVYFVGNQPEFATRVVTGPSGQTTRLLALPRCAPAPAQADKQTKQINDTDKRAKQMNNTNEEQRKRAKRAGRGSIHSDDTARARDLTVEPPRGYDDW